MPLPHSLHVFLNFEMQKISIRQTLYLLKYDQNPLNLLVFINKVKLYILNFKYRFILVLCKRVQF